MATLVLDNLPDDLMRRIERLAAADRLAVADATVRLICDAVSRRADPPIEGPSRNRTAREILRDIAKYRFPNVPGEPSIVEMIREDRAR